MPDKVSSPGPITPLIAIAFGAEGEDATAVSPSNPFPVAMISGSTVLPAGTDRSGTITTGGTAQDVAAANALRVGLTFQNTSDTVMRLAESGGAAGAATGYSVAAGQAVNVSTNKRISVFCATTGKTFAATEY